MNVVRRASVLLMSAATAGFSVEVAPSPSAPVEIRMVEAIPYGTGGGRPLLLDLAAPVAPSSKSRPAVVFIHGGGWANSDRKNGHPLIKLLAQNGFVAVSIDYRLSGEAEFPAQLEDSKCAVRFMRAHAADYGIDRDRIGVAGGSAGGHLAALVGLVPDDAGLEGKGGWEGVSSRVSAVADLYGVSDLTSLITAHKLSDAVGKLMRGTPESRPDLYLQASPLSWVKHGAPPFYLAHGDKDDTVPFDQSEKLAAALRAVGTEATLRPMTGMGHGSIGTLPDYVRTDVVAFVKAKLGAPGEPVR